MEEYKIMELLELAANRWTETREFIWSGLRLGL